MLRRASSAGRGSERLATRRRQSRRRAIFAFLVLLLLLLSATLYGLTRSAVRIGHISVFGASPSEEEKVIQVAEDTLEGQYFGLIPRDSIFFFPESRIRGDILTSNRNILAVSIFREGFTGLSLKINMRVPIGRWCGLSPTPSVEEYCYFFDANGYLYAPSATTTEAINHFALYAPLEGETLEPLQATIASSHLLPAVFDFARELATFGSPVSHIVIHNDEVTDMLMSGTSVTSVLGDEQNAFTALTSAKEKFDLAGGSIEYIDLRFPSKVYIKRK